MKTAPAGASLKLNIGKEYTMKNYVYHYRFARAVPAREIEETLILSLMAVESLHGRAQLRMEGRYSFEKKQRCCEIDVSSKVGSDLAKIFTGYVTREYGDNAVSITRHAASPHASEKCAHQQSCPNTAAGMRV